MSKKRYSKHQIFSFHQGKERVAAAEALQKKAIAAAKGDKGNEELLSAASLAQSIMFMEREKQRTFVATQKRMRRF